MASETGHAINIGHFRELIDLISSFADYNPTNPKIFKANMTTQWTTTDGLQTDLNTAMRAADIPIDDREILVDNMDPVLTRTVNYYGSSGAAQQYVDDAARIKRQITGVKKNKAPTPSPGEDQVIKTISNSHRSILKKTDNLENLILAYENDSTYYIPNEADLKTTALRATLVSLKALNITIGPLLDNIINKRIDRNYALYNEGDGIIDVAIACKKYVRGLYGVNSQEAKAVGRIKFKRFLRLKKV